MVNNTRRRLLTAVAAMPLIGTSLAHAGKDFPNRPIRVVVPYPGGDGTDVITRLLTQQLAKNLKVPVVVENRTGAAGLVGAQSVAASEPDGYSICLLVSGHITHQTLYKRFNLLDDFAPITNLATAPFALIVPTDSPYNSLGELVAAIREQPDRLTLATGGLGSPAHMAFETLRTHLGDDLTVNHIPYKSGLESAQAVVGKQTDFASAYIGSVLPLAQAQRVRVLAVTSAQRLKSLPDVPTVAELLLPEWEYNTLLFYAVPRNTQQEIIDKLYEAITQATENPELLAMLDSLAHDLDLSASPAALEDTLQEAIKSEYALIQEQGIKVAD